ncbi:HAD family hydrolase [Microbispora bryophytorum]|uniref:Hydrolase n=1 Tax=Microbispora bryophytorum TaxID=1460882 RepID=A0A8H9H5G2_9ACTN|nr:HAD family phosphatase [Microbispora bryophytorum]MBD3140083.1 HAD family phosphatase [Microbispora bryophytorum]TQS04847.1 HAD family phosphatase [Microbispora bryophytorum]GGO16568.1 hydrolase [Microbispora bryophytorum]
MSSRESPAAVLFDMDGTLVDTEDLWWDACVEVAGGLGSPLGEADREALFGLSVEDAALHISGGPGAGAVESLLTDAFTRRLKNGVTMLPGAVALLEALRAAGIPAGLVSASPRPVVDLVLETVGGHRFRLSVAAGDSARNKPAPDPYLAAAARLGVDPAACVAIEDSPTGVASARSAGCAVIVVGPSGAAGGVTAAGVTAGGVTAAGVTVGGVTAVPTLESVDLPLLRRLVSDPGPVTPRT